MREIWGYSLNVSKKGTKDRDVGKGKSVAMIQKRFMT